MIHPYDDPRLSKLLTYLVTKKRYSPNTAMDIVRELQRIEKRLEERDTINQNDKTRG